MIFNVEKQVEQEGIRFSKFLNFFKPLFLKVLLTSRRELIISIPMQCIRTFPEICQIKQSFFSNTFLSFLVLFFINFLKDIKLSCVPLWPKLLIVKENLIWNKKIFNALIFKENNFINKETCFSNENEF